MTTIKYKSMEFILPFCKLVFLFLKVKNSMHLIQWLSELKELMSQNNYYLAYRKHLRHAWHF
jgi:hypothetical protein